MHVCMYIYFYITYIHTYMYLYLYITYIHILIYNIHTLACRATRRERRKGKSCTMDMSRTNADS